MLPKALAVPAGGQLYFARSRAFS